jgi:hypothetical protein
MFLLGSTGLVLRRLRRAYRDLGSVGYSEVELGGVLLLTLQQLIQLLSALSLTYLVQVCVSHGVVVADTKLKYVCSTSHSSRARIHSSSP